MSTNSNRRGWLLDQVMLIGQLEAELTHDDEQICNIRHDMEQGSGTVEDVERYADELNFRIELAKLHYHARKQAETALFDAFPEADTKKWCDLKHSACAYTIAAEVLHARDFNPDAETTLFIMGKAVALLVSKVFGFDPMDCLRCLSEKLNADEPGHIKAELDDDNIEWSKVEVRPKDPSVLDIGKIPMPKPEEPMQYIQTKLPFPEN